jgi:hypothetical protein
VNAFADVLFPRSALGCGGALARRRRHRHDALGSSKLRLAGARFRRSCHTRSERGCAFVRSVPPPRSGWLWSWISPEGTDQRDPNLSSGANRFDDDNVRVIGAGKVKARQTTAQVTRMPCSRRCSAHLAFVARRLDQQHVELKGWCDEAGAPDQRCRRKTPVGAEALSLDWHAPRSRRC